jgi:hypothetical protein
MRTSEQGRRHAVEVERLVPLGAATAFVTLLQRIAVSVENHSDALFMKVLGPKQ